MSSPVEGWLVIDADGFAWYVKGYEHPSGGLIVTPYRRRGPRARRVHLDCVGREVDVLDNSNVAKLIDPSQALKASSIAGYVAELLDRLAPEWAGLTGSRALGGATAESDYDLLIFSSRPHEAYKALLDLREEGLVSECRWELRRRKVLGSFDEESFTRLHSVKVLDSCYRGVPYTIRILRQLEGTSCVSTYRTLGVIETIAETYDVDESYFVPARYRVLLSTGLRAVLLTWRTRYQELPRLTYYVRGLLQRQGEAGEIIVEPDIDGYIRPARSWESRH